MLEYQHHTCGAPSWGASLGPACARRSRLPPHGEELPAFSGWVDGGKAEERLLGLTMVFLAAAAPFRRRLSLETVNIKLINKHHALIYVWQC